MPETQTPAEINGQAPLSEQSPSKEGEETGSPLLDQYGQEVRIEGPVYGGTSPVALEFTVQHPAGVVFKLEKPNHFSFLYQSIKGPAGAIKAKEGATYTKRIAREEWDNLRGEEPRLRMLDMRFSLKPEVVRKLGIQI